MNYIKKEKLLQRKLIIIQARSSILLSSNLISERSYIVNAENR